jgi:hypothetical protein
VDSLVIGESIELIGSVASTNPLCTGAVFLLQPGYDLGAPQPVTSIIGSLLLDGSRPFGYQASNRTISLPVEIQAPDFQTLTAAREVLLREINQQTWTLRWTRDPGTGTALPLLFDCFRAHATVVQWGNVDSLNRFPIGLLTISFDALPYGRSDVPVVTDFPSPLAGRTAPPAAINVDTFSSVSGTQWAASTQSPVSGGQSAFWDPTIAPANVPSGTGQAAVYSKGSLALNLAAGWTVTGQGTALANNYIIVTVADAAKVREGDQLQLWNHAAGTLLQTTIFTVTQISAPAAGFVNVVFTPFASAATVLNNLAIQTGPPQLPAVTFWAGFGSSLFYPQWSRLGGRVVFAVTLTDTYGTALGFSRTVKVTGSNSTGAPRWNKIRIPVPYKAGFDYANVASYSVTTTNRGTGDLRYTQLYLSALMAVPPPVAVTAPLAAAVYELAGLPGTARAPVSLQFQQSGTQSFTRKFTLPGAFTWLCPAGVTSVAVYEVGGGGAGGMVGAAVTYTGGGGSGASANNGAIAVTPGVVYSGFVGFGGTTGSSPVNGGASSFTGDSVTLTAPGGGSAAFNAQTGGAGGAAGPGGFAGAAGGAGTAPGVGPAAGGGASSGGLSAAGNPGATGAAGGAGGAPVAFGGGGGAGGIISSNQGQPGRSPGGAGGGARPHVVGEPGGAGAPGLVQLVYTATPAFQTLLVHRPPVTAPDSLLPVVSPSPADTPNGGTQYPVGSLVPGVNGRFAGTYTIVVVAWSWNNPSAARTITVTVTQNEQAGGAAYTTSASATVTPNTFPVCSDTNAFYGPLVVVGELTLPVQDLPQDAANAYFTVALTDTNTSDAFQDILFLDTTGSTVLIQSPTGYVNYFLDEPASDRDIGLVMGSVFDRGDAVSILDRAIVAGGPMSADPEGNPHLLVYAAEGAPNLQMVHHPRWHLDRIT